MIKQQGDVSTYHSLLNLTPLIFSLSRVTAGVVWTRTTSTRAVWCGVRTRTRSVGTGTAGTTSSCRD